MNWPTYHSSSKDYAVFRYAQSRAFTHSLTFMARSADPLSPPTLVLTEGKVKNVGQKKSNPRESIPVCA